MKYSLYGYYELYGVNLQMNWKKANSKFYLNLNVFLLHYGMIGYTA